MWVLKATHEAYVQEAERRIHELKEEVRQVRSQFSWVLTEMNDHSIEVINLQKEIGRLRGEICELTAERDHYKQKYMELKFND